MSEPESPLRNISDTAYWSALYRARESERTDAVFRDPFARRLAGERGERIAATLPFGDRQTWTWTTRTYLFDRFITQQVERGVDMVINLAAGFDARPYRMELPASLRWVEIDLPELLDYKEDVLAGERPVCSLERIRLDLADVEARRRVFARLGGEARNAMILSEGLVVYLSADDVRSLATDLAAPVAFQRWVLELVSPGLLSMLQKNLERLNEAGAPLRFGPREGPGFFAPQGWNPIEVRSFTKTAARLRRLSLVMHLLSMLPESSGRQGPRPWAGVCLFARQ